VRVVERVMFDFALVVELAVVTVEFELADEVIVALLEVEVLVYAGPVPS